MPILQVIVLALVQGATEFLPISSSGHLILIPWLLGWKDQGLSFDIALHFGTCIAVVVYFFRDWLQIIGQGVGLNIGYNPELKRNPRLLWLLVAASVPAGIAGVLFHETIESQLRHPFIIGTAFILVGMLMWVADKAARLQKGIEHIRLFDAMIIGGAQALALIPGTSRSGITIIAGLFQNLDRAAAARFSFLLSTPAIVGATALAYRHLHKAGGIPNDMKTPFALGVIVSAVSGLAAISFLMNYLRKSSLRIFVYYRIVFGIIVIALAIFRFHAE